VVAPIHDGVAAQRNLDRVFLGLVVLPLDPFPQADLGDQSAVVFFIKTCMVLGSLLWDLIDGPGSGQGQDEAGTTEAPGTI
jgi:hypothetical protein